MSKPTDLRVVGTRLYFLPVETRVPLKFGPETVTHVTCARVAVTCENAAGRRVVGWGETPLSVTWVWPSSLAYDLRHEQLKSFCFQLAEDWVSFDALGDALQVGHGFLKDVLLTRLEETNRRRLDDGDEPMPYLAGLVCASAFDLAIHDAFGILCEMPVYETYTPAFLNDDLSTYLSEDGQPDSNFVGKYPRDFLVSSPSRRLPAWHLVGGLDPLESGDLTGTEPDDSYPVTLTEWIQRDGLRCLKIKLRGNDFDWDYQRVVRVGQIAMRQDVDWLTTDFNCTVQDPAYVNQILDRLLSEQPRIYAMILYVEQPFPYDLEEHRIDVRSTAARKPLFMDESAHDWQLVRLGRELGWTGVALKTCKTQTGALLSLCWATANGMTLMVQDLTNPMLAQIPHVQLAARAGTIQGVETNAMQFYPDASLAEAQVHPGLYRRIDGCVDLSSIDGAGFGYRLDEISRQLPDPAIVTER